MEIKDYLHYYMGQEVMRYQDDGYRIQLTPEEYFSITTFNIKAKPILRRLEDMTEEDAFGFWRSRYPTQKLLKANYLSPFFQVEYLEDGEIKSEHKYIHQLHAVNFHYLLSRGYDLFSLIDNNLALDSKTLKYGYDTKRQSNRFIRKDV